MLYPCILCFPINGSVCLVCLTVLDSGCGMFVETIQNMFGCGCYFVVNCYELPPENHAQGRQTIALDIVLDTDRLDYSVLGNIDPDLNILLDNNSINCRYFTEMQFHNNSFIDTNFSLLYLNI